MTEKYPPYNEFLTPRNDLGDYSDILEELTRIRQDIERDSLPFPVSHTGQLETEGLCPSSDSFQRFYRFDSDHSERVEQKSLNADSQTNFYTKRQTLPRTTIQDCDIGLHNDCLTEPLISQHDTDISFRQQRKYAEKQPKHDSCREKTKNEEIKHENRHFDDSPVVIPISQAGIRTSTQNSSSVTQKPRKDHREVRQGEHNNSHVDFTPLPWGVFSQYENETFLKLSRNACNWSLFIGWGAIACGVVIFIRSLFVSSMIWLNYGLPVVSLGAACLFLAIILNILSEKMQQINDLKQSLTAHRILLPKGRKSEKHARQQEKDESANLYDRLIQLRSEINELIDECENPS